MKYQYSWVLAVMLTVGFLSTALFPSASYAEEGHCNFTYNVSSIDASFAACRMPSDARQCASMVKDGDKTGMKYAPGKCNVEKAVGSCDLGIYQLVFYTGTTDIHKTGCMFLHGYWRDSPK